VITEGHIRNVSDEWLGETGKFLVRLQIRPGNKIHVFIDGDEPVTIDDCVKLSRYLELKLDRSKEDFELQVSSCGADQPLLLPRQYVKHEGRTLSVVTNENINYKGRLEKCTLDGITLLIGPDKKKKIPEQQLFIPFSSIAESKIEISFKNQIVK
jgi:ribosome maturation factor RimP